MYYKDRWLTLAVKKDNYLCNMPLKELDKEGVVADEAKVCSNCQDCQE